MTIKNKPTEPVNISSSDVPKWGRYHAPRKGDKKHAGVDFYIYKGTEVKSVLNGKVVRASDFIHEKYGKLVIIDHISERKLGQKPFLRYNLYTLYAHLDTVDVEPDQEVHKGAKIGTVGDTGNAKDMGPHLHFEVIRTFKELTWNKTGNTGVESGLYCIDPLLFLREFTLLSEDYEETDDMSDKEMDKFYNEITTDFRTKPRPTFKVGIPDYKEFIRKVRGKSPPIDLKPPKVKLRFENMFSPAFRSFFPSIELEVNGKNLGKIQTGTKVCELNIWR